MKKSVALNQQSSLFFKFINLLWEMVYDFIHDRNKYTFDGGLVFVNILSDKIDIAMYI